MEKIKEFKAFRFKSANEQYRPNAEIVILANYNTKMDDLYDYAENITNCALNFENIIGTIRIDLDTPIVIKNTF